ncbi:non-ribosomal peptide synthetase [Aegicerativicinus sediminis]|uniref:non-ribosomal peptide synthetase n=1 Tax=Aegicerativicinus sediminis TaxID=2893202 RepID=UPI001E46798E|nr:non-ribosomal peptide synthetase [Aegicerativicinus sediminis]
MSKNLSPAKKALFEKWVKGNMSLTSQPEILPRINKDAVELSFPQQRQLFLELLDRNTAVNNLSVLVEMSGDINLEALNISANKIINRHEVLRTQFQLDGGLPKAVLRNDLSITIPIIEPKINENLQARETVLKLVEKEVLIPFNLNQAPLIRLRLYKLQEGLHQFLIIIHHTIADGWSFGVFLKELMVFYKSHINKEVCILNDLPIQYYDYTSWLKGEKRMKLWGKGLDYWKTQLAGELPILELPTDALRGPRQSYNGGTYHFVISEKITAGLEFLSKTENATLFMTLLGAFYVVLHRYSNQHDIVIGTPVANRDLFELQGLIGVFINLLPLRLDIKGNPNFRSLLKKIKQVATEGYSHQDVPFEKLVEELKPKRDLSRTPLFQVLFNLQNSPKPKLDMPGLECSFIDIDRGVSQFDLMLMISKENGQCHATVEYNRDLFVHETIQRLFRSFQKIIGKVVVQPDTLISQLPLASENEIESFVAEYTNVNKNWPKDQYMYQLFERIAGNFPDTTAVIYGEQNISYRQLNSRANDIGKYLLNLGVSVGTRVVVLMNRNRDLIETLLGIHKAGGVFIPVHTSFPNDRIKFILRDANAPILITNIQSFTLDSEAKVVYTQEIETSNSVESGNLNLNHDADGLAYIIYTSGSTGKPKGVMINHSSLTNFLISMYEKPGINKNDVLLAVTNISFDISILELFLPLVSGAKVVVANDSVLDNLFFLQDLIAKHNVTIMQATPIFWQLLIDSGWKGKDDLKILCGGDILTKSLARQLINRSAELWNMYGPTETTIWSSLAKITHEDQKISIGHPVSNTQLFILDHQLHPLPIGIVGDLYIGGEGLASGYLSKPELTSEKFLYSPFISNGETRLYRTGDKARFLNNRSIQLLGRSDNQVKINGNRIELGEITAVIEKLPAISQAITIPFKQSNGNLKLAVYYVVNQRISVSQEELRNWLKKEVPSYMLPSYLIELEQFPLNSNGKIDRQALPNPEINRTSTNYVPATNEVEKVLIEIWKNALNIETVGIHDNFFDLGGASIQTIQVVTKANMFGYSLQIEDIFEYQTISELANFIQSKPANER